MRYLVLTDIHANIEALETCLEDATRRGYDQTLVLGDLIGYGADPNAVVARVQALSPAAVVRGNHDKVALGLEEADGFNLVARESAIWTLEQLTTEHRAWLAALPKGPALVTDLIEICHGSPFDEDEYVFDDLDAIRALKTSKRPLCLFGHTHVPVNFELSGTGLQSSGPSSSAESSVTLKKGGKYLINPGSIGQPRDGDPRAGYAIVDAAAKQVELIRLMYPIDRAQNKIIDAGLPEVLARRLAVGR